MRPFGCEESCPGCRYRDFSAEESRRKKEAWAKTCLSPWEEIIHPLITTEKRWGYRRKTTLHAKEENGVWKFGLVRRVGPYLRETVLIPIPDCPLHAKFVNCVLKDLRTYIPSEAPLVYVLLSGAILTLVMKCSPSCRWRNWARELEQPLSALGVSSLQINWNPAAGRRVVSSRHQELIFGPRLWNDSGLFYGALSFRQQIPELENGALDLAEFHLQGSGLKKIVDLYSGIGASLKRWQARGWDSIGVELAGEACEAALLNAPGTPILKGKVEHRLPQIDRFVSGSSFVLYTNPPRDGHSREVLAWIEKNKPERIAYLSCNPKSLRRDLDGLSKIYRVALVQPFDFFPQTDHVEAMALLEKSQPQSAEPTRSGLEDDPG